MAEQDGEKPSNEVVCFGCVVYEMATGEVLKSIEEIKQREFHDQLKQVCGPVPVLKRFLTCCVLDIQPHLFF